MQEPVGEVNRNLLDRYGGTGRAGMQEPVGEVNRNLLDRYGGTAKKG